MPDTTRTAADSIAHLMRPFKGDAALPAFTSAADTSGRRVLVDEGRDSISPAKFDSVASSVQFAPVGHLDGVSPEALTRLPGQSSVIMAILVALFVGAGCNPSGLRRTMARYRSELLSVRERRNAFDDDTSGGLGVMRMFLVCGAVIVCGVCASLGAGALTTAAILAGVGLAGAFYVFEYCAYALVGYAFAYKAARARWLSGFSASVALTGVFLFVPTLLLLFFPEWSWWLLPVGAGIFVVFRVVFIYKGFRIFFNGIPSLLYFILYLCTLEIIPLFAMREIYPLVVSSVG